MSSNKIEDGVGLGKSTAPLNFPSGQPLDHKAVRFYNSPGKLFPTETDLPHPKPNQFIHFGGLRYLAQTIGRQITVDDLRCLLIDEGVHTCYALRKKFRAISWPILSRHANSEIQNLLQKGKSFEEAVQKSVAFVGPFWIIRSDTIIAISGVPLARDGDESPLLGAFEKSNSERSKRRWGMPLLKAQRKVEEHKNRCKKPRNRIQKPLQGIDVRWPTK